jgi:membrane protein insertase Oxa1/YidC/SpoIIIJ
MAASQFLAMKLPQWLTKRRTKKISRMGVNPAQTQQNRTMNIVSYAMLAMIIVMGFTLPAAMGVYWFIGALFSLAQSLLTQVFLNKAKYKNKK